MQDGQAADARIKKSDGLLVWHGSAMKNSRQ
jgi:hypothetical protein